MFSLKTVTAACAVALTSGMASAATYDVMAGDLVRVAQVLQPSGPDLSFVFNIQDDVDLTAIALSASGTGGGGDIGSLRFGITPGPFNNVFNVMIGPDGEASTGSAFLPGGSFMAGDSFEVIFQDGIGEPVTVGVAFDATATPDVPPVPLPAAGGMLLLAFAGAGAGAAWKKRKAA